MGRFDPISKGCKRSARRCFLVQTIVLPACGRSRDSLRKVSMSESQRNSMEVTSVVAGFVTDSVGNLWLEVTTLLRSRLRVCGVRSRTQLGEFSRLPRRRTITERMFGVKLPGNTIWLRRHSNIVTTSFMESFTGMASKS